MQGGGESAAGKSVSPSSSSMKKDDKKMTTKDYENMMDDFAFSKDDVYNVEEELTNAMNAFYDEQMEERRQALMEIQKTVGHMMDTNKRNVETQTVQSMAEDLEMMTGAQLLSAVSEAHDSTMGGEAKSRGKSKH